MSLDWPPLKNASTGPPLLWKSSKYGGWERGDSEYFNIFNTYGGPVWDSNVFLKSVTYWPTLSKFRGGPVKKTPCISYIQIYITSYITYNTKVIPPYLLHPPPHPHLDWGDETLSAADNSRFHKFVVVYRFVSFILDNFAFWQFFADKFAIFYQFLCKGWGLSAKLGKHSAIWGKLGTALQAYALNPCTKFPPNPTSRKVNT